MKKLSIILILFFLVVTISGFGYYIKHDSKETESNVSFDEDAEYPEDLRPDTDDNDVSDEFNIELNKEDETTSNEINPDDNFIDFELEDETSDDTSDETLEDNPKETEDVVVEDVAEDATEDATENVADTTGKEIEIINSKVNIRREPNRSAKILTAVPIGTRGILLEEGDGWAYVRFGDIEGYLGNSFWKFV